MELFPIPCCCERSVDMKIFEKENKAVALNTNNITSSIPLRRSLSSKIRTKLKESMYASGRFSEDSSNSNSHFISSPRVKVCAFKSCQDRVEEKHKQTVIKLNCIAVSQFSEDITTEWVEILGCTSVVSGNSKHSILV